MTSKLLLTIVKRRPNKADLLEILHVVANDVVNVCHYHACCQLVATGVNMTGQEKSLPKLSIVNRRVGVKVDDVGVVKQICDVAKQIAEVTRQCMQRCEKYL